KPARTVDVMGSRTPTYETKELTEATWPDFEKLFSRRHGWDHCWCMAFQRTRRPSRKEFPTRAQVAVRNHQDKKQLLDQGRAHGILVYADGEPVGWCQYGPKNELPIIDPSEPVRTDTTKPGSTDMTEPWRIDTTKPGSTDMMEPRRTDTTKPGSTD